MSLSHSAERSHWMLNKQPMGFLRYFSSHRYQSQLRASQKWRKTKFCCPKNEEHFLHTAVKEQGKQFWEWGRMAMLETYWHHYPWFPRPLCHSELTSKCFDLCFTIASVLLFHITSAYFQGNKIFHPSVQLFFQWWNTTCSTMLICLQSGCSAKYVKQFVIEFFQSLGA